MKVADMMVREPVTLTSDDSLQHAVELIGKYGYDGLPVVDQNQKLVGILTEYDMVAHNSGVHLPTILNILGNVAVNKQDRKYLKEYLDFVHKIKVRDIMNPNPLIVHKDAPVEKVAKEFSEHHRVNPILVIDDNNHLVGVVSRYDIIRFFNEEYLHQILDKVPMHKESLSPLRRLQAEAKFTSFLRELSRDYLFVNKVRPRFWKMMAVAAFVIGFIASIAWIVRVSVRE